MLQHKIDILPFEKFTTAEFVQRYRRQTGCFVQWSLLKKQKTGIMVMSDKDEVYITRWANKGKFNKEIDNNQGSFVYDNPYRLKVGTNPILVRVPAFKIKNIYFIVDGVHRTTGLKPAMIVIDWVELEPKDALICVDFVGKFFQNKIKGMHNGKRNIR